MFQYFLFNSPFIFQTNNITGCSCPQGFRGDGHTCKGEILCSQYHIEILSELLVIYIYIF